jgi:hypothetical protein
MDIRKEKYDNSLKKKKNYGKAAVASARDKSQSAPPRLI